MNKRNQLINAAIEIILLVASALVIIPLLVVVFGSLKTQGQATKFSLSIPTTWEFSNYAEVIAEGSVLRAFWNSAIITFSTIVVVTISTALSSFVIARRAGRFSRFLETYFTFGLIVPWSVVSTVVLLRLLSLQNTRLGLILVLISLNIPWGSFMFSNFVRTVPREMDEAAAIDGCSGLRLFFKIIFPLLQPVIATNIVIVGMGAFNELQAPLYLLSSKYLTTLPLTVYNFKGRYYSQWNLIFADLVIVALPMIILYVVCQRYVISGVTAGAVKG